MAEREKRSTREWIDAAGNKTRPEDAVGVRFTVAGGETHEAKFPEALLAPELSLWKFASGFGYHTVCGNAINPVFNGTKATNSVEDADDNIDELLENWEAGIYRERAEGGGGQKRLNKDALAQAIAEVAAQLGLTQLKDGTATDQASVRQKLEEDEKGVWARKMRSAGDVNAAYVRIAGKPTKSLADI